MHPPASHATLSRRTCLSLALAASAPAVLKAGRAQAQITAAPGPFASTLLTARTPKLDIAYEQSGSVSGVPVVLLHGFPYGPRQYDEVRDELVPNGWRVIVPYLRGFGPTRYRSPDVIRSGQQAALGRDVIDLLDELHIPRAFLVGYDWGGHAACVAAALWPERVAGLVCSNGYAILNIGRIASKPAPPALAYVYWYQTYLNTAIGRSALEDDRDAFCELLWKLWSPTWNFTAAEFRQTASAFDNPDFVATSVQEYRNRYGNDPGDPAYADLDRLLAARPAISAPTIALLGGRDGNQPPGSIDVQPSHFKGYFDVHILPDIGHCVPAEAPRDVCASLDLLRARSSPAGSIEK